MIMMIMIRIVIINNDIKILLLNKIKINNRYVYVVYFKYLFVTMVTFVCISNF